MADIRIRRVYDPPEPDEGSRVLVNRLWPRGVRREVLQIDAWWKELAPSGELRRWFHAGPDRWDGFRGLYRAELAARAGEVREALTACTRRPLVLLTSYREPERSHAAVLREFLLELEEAGG